MKTRIVCWLLGAGLLAAPALARPRPAQVKAGELADAQVLDGYWKGPLKLTGGQLEVVFRVVKLTNGDYYATLDVPLQKVSHMPVRVEVRGDTVLLLAEAAASRFSGRLAPGGRQLSGQWSQPGYQVPMTLRHSAPSTAPSTPARLAPPYREDDVNFASPTSVPAPGGLLTLPPGAGQFATVLLLADAGAEDRNATVGGYPPLGILADYLTRRGIAVLRCNVLPGPPPTLPQRLAQALAALNYLRTRPEVDLGRLGIVGHGEGGNVALLAAAQPLPPSFVVTLAANGLPGGQALVQQQANLLRSFGTDEAQLDLLVKQQLAMQEIIRQTPNDDQAQAIVANLLHQHNPALSPAASLAGATELTSARYRYLLDFDPIPQLAAVQCPVLLLHGTADLTAEADVNLAALTKGLHANRAVVSKKLSEVNHLLQADPASWPLVNGQPHETFSPQAQEAIRAWINGLSK